MKREPRAIVGSPEEAKRRRDLPAPPAGGRWELEVGAARIWVIAENREAARERAGALLRDLGVLPSGPAGLRESFERMRAFATALAREAGPRGTWAGRRSDPSRSWHGFAVRAVGDRPGARPGHRPRR